MSQPQPEPTVGEPGGADALEHDDGPGEGTLGRDLPPDDNAMTDDVLPEEVTEPDDKSQDPEEGAAGEEASGDPDAPTEPPA